MIKLIKNEQDYENAIGETQRLMDLDPAADTPEGDQLHLLALLIEDWEKQHYPLPMPDPISAIEFRMAQQGLKQKDLIPLIGSKSKVSEVLSGKRPLTLKMIRNLHSGLGIPLESLVGTNDTYTTALPLKWKKFPFNEKLRKS